MSKDIDPLKLSDYEATAFDPDAVRILSVLPDEDLDEAYCVRHEREMAEITLVAFYMGAEYELSEGFHAMTCEACAAELASIAPDESATPVECIRAWGMRVFKTWDVGDAPAEWFVFVQERDDSPTEPDDIRVNVLRPDD